jgi:phage repressor protein C with HTH and peptisase S24 domain
MQTPRVAPSDNAKRLKSIRDRTGIGLRELARLIGWDHSRYQYYEDSYKKAYLPLDLIERIKPHLVGLGDPPVTTAEIDSLCQLPRATLQMKNSLEDRVPVPLPSRTDKRLPIRGTVSGGPGGFQMANGDASDWALMPPRLESRTDVFGLWVEDESMVPAHDPSTLIVVETVRPPQIGDDVVIELRPVDERDEQRAILKRLVGRNGKEIRVQQFNPPKVFTIELKRIIHLYRVMRMAEVLGV